MAAYYNEFDPYAAAWLRNLIAPGDVDERSILEVQPDDVRGYVQCHWFAGIGGWSLALRMAGWDDSRAFWSGSCPCQPFSVAGKQDGIEDGRHLWPAFFRLIEKCRPPVVAGEQVAGPNGIAWLDHVAADLEGAGYAVAAANLPAGSVGALHLRHRLWWLGADPNGVRWEGLEQKGELMEPQFRHEEFARLVQGEVQLSVPAGSCGAVADGVSNRVAKLRAYGNAIVPQVAAAVIGAVMECMP